MSELRQMYIGGSWAGAESGATFADYNPASGEAWAEVADAGRGDARRAIEAAQSAFPAWSRLAPTARAGYLLKVADILERRQKEIAADARRGRRLVDRLRCSRPATRRRLSRGAAAPYQAIGEILPSDHGKLSLVVREPLGVVSVISPWNFPLILSSRGFAVGARGGQHGRAQALGGNAGVAAAC